jgi:hypothetical protein
MGSACSLCGGKPDKSDWQPERRLSETQPVIHPSPHFPPVTLGGIDPCVFDASRPAIGSRSGPLTVVLPPPISFGASQDDATVSRPGPSINHGMNHSFHHDGEDQGGLLPTGSSGVQAPEPVSGYQVTASGLVEESSVAVADSVNVQQASNSSYKPSDLASHTPVDFSSSSHTSYEPHPMDSSPGVVDHTDDLYASPTVHETGHNHGKSPDEVSSVVPFRVLSLI